ncbi:hypothetical protein RQP46_002959 [Phenoliferia psychrophenolica]
MLHSAAGNWDRSFAQLLSNEEWVGAFNMVAFDNRLHGRTTGDDVGDKYTLEDSAEDTIAAITSLNLGPFALIGDSFVGAVQAAWIAIKCPEAVWALTLVSPCTLSTQPELVEALTEDLLPSLCANMDGKGDATGRIPDAALTVAHDFYFGTDPRFPDHQQAFMRSFAARWRWYEGKVFA